jgi:signal peptidase II
MRATASTASSAKKTRRRSDVNALVYWPIVVGVVLTDILSKAVAVATLSPAGVPTPVIGEWLRWTLVYNPGAAFGLYLGQYSRWIFLGLSLTALVILWRMYRQTADHDRVRTLAIALVSSGALGNLIDRVRHEYGVVDFIDVGIGASRWPTFNVADMAVSTGALLLAWVLWHEEVEEPARADGGIADGVAAPDRPLQ